MSKMILSTPDWNSYKWSLLYSYEEQFRTDTLEKLYKVV